MFAQRLLIEDCKVPDPDSPQLHVLDPNWQQIEAAIRNLDGIDRSTVVFGPHNSDEEFMVIGGGKDGIYVCNVSDKENREYALLDPTKPSDRLFDVMMGQMTTRALNEAVTIMPVLQAARTYADKGILDQSLTWREC